MGVVAVGLALALAAPAHAAAAPAPAAHDAGASAPRAGVVAPARVLVEATEFRFTLSRTTVKAGPAIVQLAIRGEDPHDLRLVPARKARSSRAAAVPETAPGGVAEWRGRLSKGKWTLYCSLPGHKRAGMRATLKVR
jgi:hypothetical protein